MQKNYDINNIYTKKEVQDQSVKFTQ